MVIEWMLFGALCLESVIIFWRELLASRMHASDHALHVSDQKVIEAQEKLCEELKVYIEKIEAQLELHRGMNEKFEAQRTQVWQLYRTAGLQMGNAQGMLLSELQRLTRTLNVYRLKLGEDPVKVDSEILATVNRFREEHGSERPDKLVAHG